MMLWASVNGGSRFGIVAEQMPSSSPVIGFRCACAFLSSVAMALSSFRLFLGYLCGFEDPAKIGCLVESPQASQRELDAFLRQHPSHETAEFRIDFIVGHRIFHVAAR